MPLSLIGLFLSIATGVAIAVYYVLNKKITHVTSPLQVIFWVFAAHLPPLMIWAALTYPLHVEWGYVLPGLGVLGLTVTGNLLAIRALSLSPFSLMVPVLCLTPAFTSLIGIPLLQETPTHWQWLGILLAVIGVLWLYAPPQRPWDILSFWSGFFRERGAPGMLMAALAWSISAPMDRLALRHADPAFHALFVFGGLVMFLFVWLTLRGEWQNAPMPRSVWKILALAGTAGATADILQLLALLHIHAGTFEAVKRVTSQVLAVILGYYLFQEQLTKPKIIGMIILSIGVPMIVL